MKFYEIVHPVYRWAAKVMCRDCSPYIKPGLKMLDLGCGSGIVSKEFAEHFKAQLTGVDIIDNRIFPINFKLINGRNLPFSGDEFDVILISYVLHHADDPVRLLGEAKRVLRPGGKIIIFEDLYQGFIAKILCHLHGSTYGVLFEHHSGKEQYNFKDLKQWKTVFKTLELRVIFDKRVSRFINPVHKHLFILEK